MEYEINEHQTLISHSNGAATRFNVGGSCVGCFYKDTRLCNIDAIPCYTEDREDALDGNFVEI